MTASEVLAGERLWSVEKADVLAFFASLPDDSLDLVLGSPPYCDARTYGIDAVYSCPEWVEWMLKVTEAATRVSRGLVLWVCAGVQRENNYWPGPEGLQWEWFKLGGHSWRPVVWWKVDRDEGGTAIPGSGGSVPGRRWLRADWEHVLAFKKPGKIPYDDPLAMGHEPVVPHLGGEMSNRTADGRRSNDRVGGIERRQGEWADDPWKTASRGGSGCGGRRKNGEKMAGPNRRRNGEYKAVERDMPPGPVHDAEGNIVRAEGRPFPKVVNPGNVLPLIVKARVGGGHMGSKLCHENEAPYPEALPEFFVPCYAPPGGIVCDPFVGSGTTAAVSVRLGRRFVGCDLRESQVRLARRRVGGETLPLFPEA